MKLVSYLKNGHDQLAFWVNDYLYDADLLHPELPSSMTMFLNFWEETFPIAAAINDSIIEGRIGKQNGVAGAEVQLLSPVPFPTSFRDAYAFRQHVEAARRSRKLPMIP